MDIQRLFLSPNGRSGRGEFWIGFLILFVLGWVLNFLHGIGHLIGLLLIYPWVCLYSKRLHDMGKSGWLAVIPFAVMIVGFGIAFAVGAGSAIMAMANGGHADMGVLAGAGMAVMVIGLALLVCLAFLLWVGLTPSQPGDNAYGPPPVTASTAPAA